MRKYAPQMILIGLVILFSIISPNFLTSRNIIILIRQVSFAAISAVGVSFVMISGGIDLSIGSQIVMTNIVLAIMMVYGNLPMSVAIPLTLLLGT
ncbi:MAG: ribose ABC transporter permease, partial [Chloroflexi bacterium]|nr:ribose ABC transporter permease [Chloroflexota bacterium]